MAAWSSGNGIGRINEVTLRRTRLLPGWVTVFGRANHLGIQLVRQANSSSYLRGTGNEYRSKCGDVLRLGSKGRMVHEDKRVGGR